MKSHNGRGNGGEPMHPIHNGEGEREAVGCHTSTSMRLYHEVT